MVPEFEMEFSLNSEPAANGLLNAGQRHGSADAVTPFWFW